METARFSETLASTNQFTLPLIPKGNIITVVTAAKILNLTTVVFSPFHNPYKVIRFMKLG
jgi:hypothetical protein